MTKDPTVDAQGSGAAKASEGAPPGAAQHPNAALLEQFYAAFARRDGAAMAACYAPDARFGDPVFPDLRGAEPGAMWRMLTARGKDLEISFGDVVADDAAGRVRWEARYTFGPTGRRVHNVVEAEFRFRDGKIVEHRDRFDLPRWMGMALGPVGAWFGGSALLQGMLRRRAAKDLALAMRRFGAVA